MNADNFNLETLISSMKDLRHMQLGDQVRQALEGARLGFDANTLAEIVRELESDIEEHVERLEKISGVLSADERAFPERMDNARRQEVAFSSGCDLEEVDSLCEAFSRAREILAGTGGRPGFVDLKLLFSNLPGISGIEIERGPDGVPKVPAQIIEELLGGKWPRPARKNPAQESAKPPREPELEELFDLEKPAMPKNRLPKDWKP